MDCRNALKNHNKMAPRERLWVEKIEIRLVAALPPDVRKGCAFPERVGKMRLQPDSSLGAQPLAKRMGSVTERHSLSAHQGA
jgi:hypothetical protein